jgi:ketosteroid isomerase-like protein
MLVRIHSIVLLQRLVGHAWRCAETIKKRFRVFQTETMPIVKHYEESGRVFHIDGAPSPEQVFSATMRAVTPVLEKDVLAAVSRLLGAIDSSDWATYSRLCAEDMSAVEGETHGAVVRGLAFHKYYFQQHPRSERVSTMLSPDVRLLDGTTAVVAYIRAVQHSRGTSSFSETRVMKQKDGEWRCVHFHRSPAGELCGEDTVSEALGSLDAAADSIVTQAKKLTESA